MNKQMYILPPFAGAVVRHPHTGTPIAQDGEWVDVSTHWRRQVAMGEVVERVNEQQHQAAGVAEQPVMSGTTRSSL